MRVSPARRSVVRAAVVASLLVGTAGSARAQAGPPSAHEDDAFDIMNLMAAHGLHDLHDEPWNLYGQFTSIGQWKAPFHAKYTNATGLGGKPGSLVPSGEGSYTDSLTFFGGVRLWKGGEAYIVPEVIAERPLSGLHGIGGAIQNFELQKTGAATPQLYRSRTYIRQTINLGGNEIEKTSDPMQLEATVTSRRLVFTVGNFSILDIFDKSSIAWDPRQTFVNMAFMTHASWDFTSDARGYSWGGTAELFFDDWAVRFAHMTPPKHPNQLETEFRLWKYFGEDVELEHDHKILQQAGAVRVIGYRNHVETGNFDNAINAFVRDPSKNAAGCNTFNYGSTNANAPDLCWVRKPTVKLGIGVSVEQHFTEDIGIFFRGMYSDGKSEVDAFNSADSSVSIGATAKGALWHRKFDVFGTGFGASWISSSHAKYLELGGVDGFIGDGKLNRAAETVFEVFYSYNVLRAFWLTADYQHIGAPAYNADRGPVNILSGRLHAEF